MLVDQHNRNIFPLLRETVECPFNRAVLRLRVDDEVVLLRVWGVGDVLWTLISSSVADLPVEGSRKPVVVEHTPTPASKMPVTESWTENTLAAKSL